MVLQEGGGFKERPPLATTDFSDMGSATAAKLQSRVGISTAANGSVITER